MSHSTGRLTPPHYYLDVLSIPSLRSLGVPSFFPDSRGLGGCLDDPVNVFLRPSDYFRHHDFDLGSRLGFTKGFTGTRDRRVE